MALVLGASSVTMAIARGQTRAAGEVVICSGYGLTTIHLDAAGNLVESVLICPDMALAMFVAPETAPPTLDRPEGQASDLILVEPRLPESLALVNLRARGPPVRSPA
ncbi:hypothetical protein [Phaeovulum sp.]|uniref:hypothetical protein n=1 Tax=Phaeovulum sp. TaxID=2934796 RepID=UPI0027318DFB|nr:hypothetical protein [Phaeovulum sp.]MDP1667939.1 hypothetical protein [Phaeovulum sp.]MDZ4120192.1 hypothetical protein [Phaeovulum sp.]